MLPSLLLGSSDGCPLDTFTDVLGLIRSYRFLKDKNVLQSPPEIICLSNLKLFVKNKKKRKKRTNRRDTKPNALSLLTFLHAFTCIFRRKRIFRKLALTYDDREAALKRKFDPAFSKQLVFRCS